jgi:uncharacterized protein YecE (DUF72 family)
LVDWYLGTVGFSYKDWEGVFYPGGISARQYLAYYSQIFNGVELDSTFYGTPPAERVRQWAASTPAAFKFCAKTPRQITHDLRLVGAREAMLGFLDIIGLLGEKLGAVLIQLPPSLTAAQVDTVAAFLEGLPANFQYALEFRHPSWFTPETNHLLTSCRVCWVSTEYIDMPKQIERTSDFLYLRWLGRHGQYKRKDREEQDMTPHLAWWKTQLQPHLPQLQSVYGFFNNDYSGHSPATCNRFKALLGLPVTPSQTLQQGRLF